MAKLDLTGKVAVVTGGASGIGRSCALVFAAAGADVAIADLHPQRLAETAAEIESLGRRAMADQCDVASDDEVAGWAESVIGGLGVPAVAMFNAGVSVLGPPDQIPLDDWKWQFEVNVFGIVRGVNAFAPAMRERGSGHVVITASIAGRYAYTYDAGPYIASKHAAYGYAENLALYLRPQGVDVSVVCPGLVSTNLGESARFAGLDDPTGWTYFPERMMRPLEPDDVATQVVDALAERRFLVYTHAEDEPLIAARAADVDAAIAAQIAEQPDPTPPS